ncbi:hypothetical protein H4Q26_015774 [Puccinia striiformis f. sp. tritici PST-130]|nr:hypothetical protein H4Q26_015774 [Puccinia striiformis f. sp. tritici PST-130]
MFLKEWEADHKVTEDLIDGPPSRRANASFTPDPNQPYIWLFGGGEFASSNQTTFHHYRDMLGKDRDKDSTIGKKWTQNGSMETMDNLVRYVGIRTNYLSDLWFFDMLEYKWQQITSRDNERWPSARSGLSLLSIPEGIILHGGYSKVYITKSKAKGVALDDTFFLKLDPTNPDWLKKLKWEKRKRVGQVPNLRSGSTMVNWVNKALAVGFGGVLDLEDNEEGLVSEFYNDLYAYQLSGNGRWMSLNLKKPKKKKGGYQWRRKEEDEEVMELDEEDRIEEARLKADQLIRDEIANRMVPSSSFEEEEDPEKTIPLARFNPMLAVLKILYTWIYESGDKEYTLQSFYSLALDKLDRYICLRDDDIHNHEWFDDSESGSDDDEEDEDGGGSDGSGSDTDSNDEAHDTPEQEELKKKVEAFMGVAKSTERSIEEIMSTPLPGETLKLFYDRSREYWTQKAHATSQHRGKELRRDAEYKPLLDEIERIQAEAGIEASDVQRRTGPTVGGGGLTQDSRHRR